MLIPSFDTRVMPMPQRASERSNARRLTVRRLSIATIAAFGALAIFVIGGLEWNTMLLHHSITMVLRDAESRAIASELQLSLLTLQRLRNLHVLSGEAELRDAADELGVRIQQLLVLADAYSGSIEEQRLIDEVSGRIERYLRERDRLDAHGAELADAVRLSQPVLDAAVSALQSLHAVNDAQVRHADADARRIHERSNLAGAIAGTVLVLGLAAVALGVRHSVLRPVLALHHAIGRFESGQTQVRAEDGGLRELAELTQGFNAMADTLARQREAQLEFLAGVAHDLRNPLDAIKLGIQVLEIEQSAARRGRARERLDRQVERLARMVEDLLDATRIEAGQLELRPEPLDLRDVAQDMVRLYAPTSPEHQITVRVPPERVPIRGDPLRLEQVVSNLLSNAIKFSPGGGTIEVVVSVEGEHAVLSVSDRGIGIPKDEQADVFLPFRRRHPEVAPGAGLGLSVVRRIVTAHGGSIEVDSEPGRGSTFRVRLPRSSAGEA